MKVIVKSLFTGLCLIVGSTAFADTIVTATPSQNFYFGADAGFGSTSCRACSFSATDSGSTSNTGLALDLFGGYQLNSYVAFEVGLGSLPAGKTSISISPTNEPNKSTNTMTVLSSTNHVYGAVKAILPLQNQFGLFAKVGYDTMLIESSGNLESINPTGVFLAVGGSYTLKTNLAATLSYNQILDSESGTNVKVGYGTVGLTYLF